MYALITHNSATQLWFTRSSTNCPLSYCPCLQLVVAKACLQLLLPPQLGLQLTIVLVTHLVVLCVDPFGHAPLDPLDHWACGVQGELLQITIRLHGVEQDGITLLRLSGQDMLGAVREVGSVEANGAGDLGEDSLPTLLHCGQECQDSGVPVAAIDCVDLVKEVVPVGLILLGFLVAQDLKTLTIVHWHVGPVGNSPLNGLDDGVLSSFKEHAITCTDVVNLRSTSLGLNNTRAFEARQSLLHDVVSLFLREQAVNIEDTCIPVQDLHPSVWSVGKESARRHLTSLGAC
mmetsp:Transcript_359/g.723  ORF Transcript_359/g.723 Transcript_359/m.723 type:complete len:289 (+) Transcript_359:896-1762(+)